MKPVKNLPVYVLSGALIFVGIASASQAQAVWTSKETSRVKTLEAKVQQLEKQLGLQELVTVRYLAIDGSGGTYGDICPGNENLDFEGGYASYIGRLTPKTNLFGIAETNAVGAPITKGVYACKIQFYAKKSN
jgi:hypothetical protein